MSAGKLALILGLAVLTSVATFMAVQHKDQFINKSSDILSVSEVSHMNIPDLHLRVAEFNAWTVEHNKRYSKPEALRRFNNWIENYNIVEETNAQNLSYTLGMNHFADLTLEEFTAMYMGFDQEKALKDREENSNIYAFDENLQAPTSIDWRAMGAVGPIKQQGQCGGCWSFTAATGLEALHKIRRGSLPDFSEQQMIDCAGRYGLGGCNGGTMTQAYQYTRDFGIQQESTYPYRGYQSTCRYSGSNVFKNTGFQNIQQNYLSIQNAVANQVVGVGVAASSSVFQMYRGGVITSSGCGTGLNHAISIVGYATNTASGSYWIVRNSWATTWGEQGYGRIAMAGGSGICGINMMASVPTV